MRAVATGGALLLVLSGCAAEAQRDGTGAVTAVERVAVERLRVGDCLTAPGDGVVTDLQAVPCAQAHDAEVFHAFSLPDGDFPGDDAVQLTGGTRCAHRFTAFVGTAYDDSSLELLPLTPVGRGWAAGDRGVLCVVQDRAGGLTGTLEGVRR